MIWSNETRSFEAPSGKSITVNMTARAWCLLETDGSRLRAVAQEICSSPSSQASAAWRSVCLDVPQNGDGDDVVRWLSATLDTPTGHGSAPSAKPVRLLSKLRERGMLLWPVAIRWTIDPLEAAQVGTRLHLMGGKSAYELSLVPSRTAARRFGSSLLMACSPFDCADDFSVDALLAVLGVAANSEDLPQNISSGLLALPRRIDGLRRSDGTDIVIAEAAEKVVRAAGIHRKSPQSYVQAREREDAAAWVGHCEELGRLVFLKLGGSQISAFDCWLDYLMGFPTIPTPAEIRRELHMEGSNGFLAFLKRRYDVASARYNKNLNFLQQLFDVLVEKGEMAASPLRQCDRSREIDDNNTSDKALIPREILDAIRNVLTELVDHAFSQADALSDGVWRLAGIVPGRSNIDPPSDHHLLPATILKPGNFERLAVTLRSTDGRTVRVLNPVLPVSLLWLAKVPNRGIESRMVDSGEGDEFVPEIRIEVSNDGVERVRSTWRANTHPLATPGRRQCAIRLIEEGDRDVVGLYANINKSQEGGHKDGADRGRELPWEDPELHRALFRAVMWQSAFNPVDRFLARDQLRTARMQPSEGLRGKMPGYAFLFRHAQDHDLAGRFEPISHDQQSDFLHDVLDEVEARIAANPPLDPDRGEPVHLPKIVLARDAAGRPTRWAYSLHCFRVTGLTALNEAGVPFWIISKIVAGHTSWMMTLRYCKVAPGKLVEAIETARRKMREGDLARASLDASEATEAEMAGLVVSDGPMPPRRGNQIPGFWMTKHDGMCPNGETLCHEGGPIIEGTKRHGPVEGGARNCALCRFFLTGPRFREGQVALVNATLYQARRQGLGLQALWIERRSSDGTRRLRLDDAVARAEAELNLTVRALNARVRLLHKSIALADLEAAGDGRPADAPPRSDLLITRMGEGEVEAHLRAASDLGFLDEVSRIAALVPEQDIQDVHVEFSTVVDRLLDRDGFEATLFRMPREEARLAGNAIVDGVRAQAPPGIEPGVFLDDLAEGRNRLFNLDMPRIIDEMSRAVGRSIRMDTAPRRDGGPSALPSPDQREPSA